MTVRPQVIAFDVIETLFSLESLRKRFEEAGLPGPTLELWFASALRDMFALAASGSYSPMRKVLEGALDEVCAGQRAVVDKKGLLKAMATLPPYPDVEPGLGTLENSGFRIIAVTNGSESNTKKLLEGAGVASLFETLVSTDHVERAKPHPDVYLHAATTAGVEPNEMMLIAAHPWDIHGAKSAGLKTAYLDRGKPYPRFMKPPDLTEKSLTKLANSIAHRGSSVLDRAIEELTG